MRACVLLAAVGAAAAGCPAHPDVANVYLGSTLAAPLHAVSDPATGAVSGAPWSWIPQDNVILKSFSDEKNTLTCGNYYGYPCRRTENGTQITVECKSEVCDVYAFIYHEPPRSTQTNGRLPLTLPANDWQSGSCAPEFCIPAATAAPSAATAAPSAATAAPSAATAAPSAATAAPSAATLPPQPTFTAAPTQGVVAPAPGHPDAELPDARKAGALDAQMECCRMTAFRKQAEQGKAVSFSVDEAFGTMDAYYLVLAVAPGVDCGSNSRQSQESCEEQPEFGNARCRWVPADSEPQARSRAAEALSGIPTSSPTASPVGGRCVDNWCPRVQRPPVHQPAPMCSAPLTEPSCGAPPGGVVPQ